MAGRREDGGEFIDDQGDSDSHNLLDDRDKDRDYVFGKGFSENKKSSDDEREGPSATTCTVADAASSPSTSWLQLTYIKYAGKQHIKCIRSEGRRCGNSGVGEVTV